MVDILAAPHQSRADASRRTLAGISIAHWVSHFHLFVLPMLRAMLGRPDIAPETRRAALAVPVGPTGPRTHYMRARLERGHGLPAITPFDRQDSALLSVLAAADALLIRPQGDGARKAGETVDFLPL